MIGTLDHLNSFQLGIFWSFSFLLRFFSHSEFKLSDRFGFEECFFLSIFFFRLQDFWMRMLGPSLRKLVNLVCSCVKMISREVIEACACFHKPFNFTPIFLFCVHNKLSSLDFLDFIFCARFTSLSPEFSISLLSGP